MIYTQSFIGRLRIKASGVCSSFWAYNPIFFKNVTFGRSFTTNTIRSQTGNTFRASNDRTAPIWFKQARTNTSRIPYKRMIFVPLAILIGSSSFLYQCFVSNIENSPPPAVDKPIKYPVELLSILKDAENKNFVDAFHKLEFVSKWVDNYDKEEFGTLDYYIKKSYVSTCIKVADALYKDGNYKIATSLYFVACKKLSEVESEDSFEALYILMKVAKVLRKAKKYVEAEELYLRCLAGLENREIDHEEEYYLLSYIHKKYATLLAHHCRYETALYHLNEAASLAKKHSLFDSTVEAYYENMKAVFFIEDKRYDDAIAILQNLLDNARDMEMTENQVEACLYNLTYCHSQKELSYQNESSFKSDSSSQAESSFKKNLNFKNESNDLDNESDLKNDPSVDKELNDLNKESSLRNDPSVDKESNYRNNPNLEKNEM